MKINGERWSGPMPSSGSDHILIEFGELRSDVHRLKSDVHEIRLDIKRLHIKGPAASFPWKDLIPILPGIILILLALLGKAHWPEAIAALKGSG